MCASSAIRMIAEGEGTRCGVEILVYQGCGTPEGSGTSATFRTIETSV